MSRKMQGHQVGTTMMKGRFLGLLTLLLCFESGQAMQRIRYYNASWQGQTNGSMNGAGSQVGDGTNVLGGDSRFDRQALNQPNTTYSQRQPSSQGTDYAQLEPLIRFCTGEYVCPKCLGCSIPKGEHESKQVAVKSSRIQKRLSLVTNTAEAEAPVNKIEKKTKMVMDCKVGFLCDCKKSTIIAGISGLFASITGGVAVAQGLELLHMPWANFATGADLEKVGVFGNWMFLALLAIAVISGGLMVWCMAQTKSTNNKNYIFAFVASMGVISTSAFVGTFIPFINKTTTNGLDIAGLPGMAIAGVVMLIFGGGAFYMCYKKNIPCCNKSPMP